MKQRMRQAELLGGKRHAVAARLLLTGTAGITRCGIYINKSDTIIERGLTTSISCKRCLASIAKLDRVGAI